MRAERGPRLPREAMSGGWHRRMPGLGLFFSGRHGAEGMGTGLSGCRAGLSLEGRRGQDRVQA